MDDGRPAPGRRTLRSPASGAGRPRRIIPTQTRSVAMKPSIFRFKPLLLSLLLCAGAAMASEPVDINSADAAQLDKVLIGVGAAKAEAIIEYRKANGPFKSADELANVKGIGLKTVERNRDLIKVGGARAQAAPASAPAKAAAPAAAAAKPVARR
ncbi:MAG: helix-hairpin-helix domain-containing protein [Pseudoxanthomonas sp.]|nr:helix-hairpin-helix domain-containing protein [Pseudoxanthomonas sp.]